MKFAHAAVSQSTKLRAMPAFCIVLWLCLMALTPGLMSDWFDGPSVLEITGWLTILTFFAMQVTVTGRLFPSHPVVLTGAILLTYLTLITQINGLNASRPLLLALLCLLAGASMPLIALRQLPRIIVYIGWLVMGIATLDFFDYIPKNVLQDWRMSEFPVAYTYRWSGPFFHPNVFAFFLMIQWFAAFWLFRVANATKSKTLLVYTFAFLTMFFMANTFSRIAMGSWFLGVLIGVIWHRRLYIFGKLRPAIKFISISFLGLFFGMSINWPSWYVRIVQLEDMAYQAAWDIKKERAWGYSYRSFEELENAGRLEIWRDASLFIQRDPIFGFGYTAFSKWGPGHLHAHNIVVELLVSGGSIALLLFLILLFSLVIKRRGPPSWLLFVLIPIAFTGIGDCYLIYPYPLMLTAFIIGGACRPYRDIKPVEEVAARLRNFNPEAIAEILRYDPKWIRLGVALSVLFVVGTAIRLHLIHENYTLPVDVYAYGVSSQYVLETGAPPYVHWPANRLEVPYEVGPGKIGRLYDQEPLRFFYPPTGLVIFQPLGYLMQIHPRLCVWTYFIFQLAIIALIAWGVVKLAGRQGIWWLPMLLIPIHAEVIIDLIVGNVSLVLAAAALWIWLLHCKGKSFSAGLILSIVVSLKVFPILWLGLLYLRPKGGWKVVVGMLGGCAFFVLVSLLQYGPEFWVAWEQVVWRPLKTYPPPGPNISFLGLIRNNYTDFETLMLHRTIGLFLLGTLFLLGDYWRRKRGYEDEISAFAIICLSIAAVPVAWSHYVIIPLGFSLAYLIRLPSNPHSFTNIIGLLFYLFSSQSYEHSLVPYATFLSAIAIIIGVLSPLAVTLFAPSSHLPSTPTKKIPQNLESNA